MEDTHGKEVASGTKLKAPLIQRIYHFVGINEEEGAIYYRFRNQLYRCESWLGSIQHHPVDEEEVRSTALGSSRWIQLDGRPCNQDEAARLLQQFLADDQPASPPPPAKKGFFKTLVEALVG